MEVGTTSEDKGYCSKCLDPFQHPFLVAGDKDVPFLVEGVAPFLWENLWPVSR